MPAVAGLAEMVAALFALLIAVAAYLLLRAIGSGLPNFSILGVGINIGHWFEGLANHVAQWIVDIARFQWTVLRDMFNAVAWLIDHSFNATVNAISHAFDYVDHVVGDVIPDAITTAKNFAHHQALHYYGLAETDIKAAAGRIDTLFTRTVPDAISAAEHYTDSAIDTLHRTLTGDIATAKAAVEGDLHDVKVALAGSIADLAKTVASDYTNAKAIAQSDATAALNTAKDLISDARTYARDIAHADAKAVQDTLQKAIDATNTTVTTLTSTVTTDFNTAEAYAQQQVAAGLADVVDTLNHTAVQVGGAIGAAAAGVAGQITGAVTQAQTDATTALDTAEAAVGKALGDIYTDVTGQALAANGDLASIAGSLGLALAGSIAGVVARVAKLEKCSVGVCDDSPNNFSSLLKDALGVTEAAGAFAYLEQAVTDPAGTATTTSRLIRPVVDDSVKLLDTLLGLPAL